MTSKLLSVPLSAAAARRIDFDSCVEGDLLEASLDEAEYEALRASGLLEVLNSALDLLIDDYEDEEIVGVDDLEVARSIAGSYAAANPSSRALAEFVRLLDAAIAAETKFMMYF